MVRGVGSGAAGGVGLALVRQGNARQPPAFPGDRGTLAVPRLVERFDIEPFSDFSAK